MIQCNGILYRIDYQGKTYIGEYSQNGNAYWTRHHLKDNIPWRNDEDIQGSPLFSKDFFETDTTKIDDTLDKKIEETLSIAPIKLFHNCESISYNEQSVVDHMITSLDMYLENNPDDCPFNRNTKNKGERFLDRVCYFFNYGNDPGHLRTIEMLLMYIAQASGCSLWNVQDNFGILSTPEQKFTPQYILSRDKDAGAFSLMIKYGFKLEKFEPTVQNLILKDKILVNRYGVALVDISKEIAKEVVKVIPMPISKLTVKHFIATLKDYKEKVEVTAKRGEEKELLQQIDKSIKYMQSYLTTGKHPDLRESKKDMTYADFVEDVKKNVFSKIPQSKTMNLLSEGAAEKYSRALIKWIKTTNINSILSSGDKLDMEYLKNYYNNLYSEYVVTKFCTHLPTNGFKTGANSVPLTKQSMTFEAHNNDYLMTQTAWLLNGLKLNDKQAEVNRLLLSAWHKYKYGPWAYVPIQTVYENAAPDSTTMVMVPGTLQNVMGTHFYWQDQVTVKWNIVDPINSPLDIAKFISKSSGCSWVLRK